MSTTSLIVGVTVQKERYDVWFHQELGSPVLDIGCSYCGRKPSRLQLAIVELIADAEGNLVPKDSVLDFAITKELIEKLTADKTVCTRPSCHALLKGDTEKSHRRAGVRRSR